MSDAERRVALGIEQPETLEQYLRRCHGEPAAPRVAIAMLALGLWERVDEAPAEEHVHDEEIQRDLALLASIGGNDPRALHALSLARRLESTDYYELLGVPRAATRAQILSEGERKQREYDPAAYPAQLGPYLDSIRRRIDEAVGRLSDPHSRSEYDRIAGESGGHADDAGLQQAIVRKSIARKNYQRACELSGEQDYYGAIVLLRQAVEYDPEFADAWFLLGSCQERNPRWRRQAVTSLQRALAIRPDDTEVMISLGDLYTAEGLVSRAVACYQDVIALEPENAQAKSRLKALQKKK
jgi:tetratricopeptide (TPR) repeat protein